MVLLFMSVYGVLRPNCICQMKRDLYWDSLKFVLIFLVVYGHTIETYSPNGSINRAIYNFIYVFHMPLFIFISGRFSQIHDSKRYKKGILRIFETYVTIQAIKIFPVALITGDISLNTIVSFIVGPRWTLWYLLCLVYWRIIVYILPEKILNNNPISVLMICFLIGLISGFIPVGAEFSIQRALAFLPFFFLGYYSMNIDIKKYVNKIPISIAIIVILIVFLLLYFFLNMNISFIETCRFSYWSTHHHISPILQCLARGALFVSAMLLGAMIMRLVPTKASLSTWGKATLTIYVFHSFVIQTLRSFIGYGYIPQNEYLLFIYAIAIVFCLLYLSQFKFVGIILNPISYYRDKTTSKRSGL